jgi:hypothetical protein
LGTIAKKREQGKAQHADFDGKACWVGVDVHKSSYAVAIMDEDGQRLEFPTPAEPKKLLLQPFQFVRNLHCAKWSGSAAFGEEATGGAAAYPGLSSAHNGLEEPSSLDSWSCASVRSLQEMPLPVYLRLSLDSYLEEHACILELR